MDNIIYSLSFAAMALASVMAFKSFDKRLALNFGLLFALYLALDDFATGLPYFASVFDIFPGRWNWDGKVFSILLAVAAILAFRINPKAVGLTFAQRNLKASVITTVLYIPWAITLGFLFKPDVSAEALAFQATMPGLAEELAFRGVAPALLLGLIHGKQPSDAMPWTVVFITAIMFGLWHGFGYSGGSFSFDLMSFGLTGFGGLIACWLRFNSGSLLFPILLHSIANVAFQLTGLVGA